MHVARFGYCFVAVLALAQSPDAPSLSFRFDKVADSETRIPKGSGKFRRFSFPAIFDGRVSFAGEGEDLKPGEPREAGIYTGVPGELERIADLATSIPGGVGTFSRFLDAPSARGGKIAFFAAGTNGQRGLYVGEPGKLVAAADLNTAIPNGNGKFLDFAMFPSPGFDGNNVAFTGIGGEGQVGVYSGKPTDLKRVADRQTDIPDGKGKFGPQFGTPTISDGKTAFRGNGDRQNGIYTDRSGTLSVVARRGTAVPPPQDNQVFALVDAPAISDGRIAFRGSSSNTGIYSDVPGKLVTVADGSTDIPDGKGKFKNVVIPALSGKNAAFHARGDNGQEGIYLDVAGSLQKVVDLNTKIDGKAPIGFRFSRDGLDGTSLAFWVQFADGTIAIYRAVAVRP
jgi:hypothetical protein